jgi:multiple sugar transport system substrate-binding protein
MKAGTISIERKYQIAMSVLRHCLIVLLICLTLGLTACGNPAIDRDVIHLTLWQGVNPPANRAVLQKLVDKFNQQHPRIQVESLYIGQSDQQMPKILAAVVGDAVPDLLWYGPMLTGQLVELGAIKSIDQQWQNSTVTPQVDPALLSSMRYQDHLWSIPFGTNNVGIFYRSDLLREAGVTTVPKTWSALRAVAKQLTKPGQHGMLLPLGKGEWTVFTWLPFMWSGGGDLNPLPATITYGNNTVPGQVVATNSTVTVNNLGAIAALQLWQDLITDGSAVLSMPERGYELDKFLAGKVAMQLTGPWTFGQLAETKVEYGVMPIPAGKTAQTVVGGENLFMMKSTPEREQAAWQFMEYVLGAEFQTAWALGTGYLPVNLGARQSAAYQDFVQRTPGLQVFLDQAAVGKSRPIAPGYGEISENLGRAIESVLLQKSTVQEALTNAQRRLELSQ